MSQPPKFSYSCHEINWVNPEEFFYSSHSSRTTAHHYSPKISFFIHNPPSVYPNKREEKEDEWCYLSCDGNNFCKNTSDIQTTSLFTIHITPNDNFEKISQIIYQILSKKISAPDEAPSPFNGGLIGFLNYEALAMFEKITLRPKEKSPVRESIFFVPSSFVAFNKTKKRAYLYTASLPPTKNLSAITTKASRNTKFLHNNISSSSPLIKFNLTSNLTKENFKTAVYKVKKYISSGDIFQANIARRWQIPLVSNTCPQIPNGKTIFLNLLKINPSPYACYLKFNDTEIISCSPELLVRRRSNIIETRPIAGTRPRGNNPKQDKNLSNALILSPKERAEHIMLVDLERNDLGKICRHGSVKVAKPLVIEKYSHVQHIVSYIKGKARKNLSPFDILRALFPGGTITGCPKIRAIEIIDEVEPVERGPYCGSLGWINGGKEPNALEFNILIRTIIKTHHQVEFYAGAGIVADSNPQKEFEETRYKALALARAMGVKNLI